MAYKCTNKYSAILTDHTERRKGCRTHGQARIHTDRQTAIQTYRHKYRNPYTHIQKIHTGGRAHIHTESHTDTHTGIHTYIYVQKYTHRPAGRQTSQTEKEGAHKKKHQPVIQTDGEVIQARIQRQRQTQTYTLSDSLSGINTYKLEKQAAIHTQGMGESLAARQDIWDKHAYSKSGRQGRQAVSQLYIHTYRNTYINTYRDTANQAAIRQAGRLTDIERHTYRKHTYR